MLFPWNSRELIYTPDMSTYALVRDVLAQNNIYFVRNPLFATWYRLTDTRAGCGMEYRVFVKKRDYENALYLVSTALKNR